MFNQCANNCNFKKQITQIRTLKFSLFMYDIPLSHVQLNEEGPQSPIGVAFLCVKEIRACDEDAQTAAQSGRITNRKRSALLTSSEAKYTQSRATSSADANLPVFCLFRKACSACGRRQFQMREVGWPVCALPHHQGIYRWTRAIRQASLCNTINESTERLGPLGGLACMCPCNTIKKSTEGLRLSAKVAVTFSTHVTQTSHDILNLQIL